MIASGPFLRFDNREPFGVTAQRFARPPDWAGEVLPPCAGGGDAKSNAGRRFAAFASRDDKG